MNDDGALAARIQAASPAIDMHNEFLPARFAIRLSCGERAAALEAELAAVETKCALAAMDERTRLLLAVRGTRE